MLFDYLFPFFNFHIFTFSGSLEEGVFRLSGNVQEVDDLKSRFNKGKA